MTLREITYMFPAPGIDVSKSSDPTAYNTFVSLESSTLQKRWQDADGIAILHTLRGNNFERAVLEKAVGRINGKFDLRGIPLDQCDLRGVDLSDCDLYRSTLRDANLSRANFAGSFLSEADIRGANFDWCRLDGTYLDNVTFDSKTSFLGVDLNGVNFTLAARVRELALSQQIIKELEANHPLLARVLAVTSDYGRSFTRFAIWCVGIILLFGLLYFGFEGSITSSGELGSWGRLFESFYFSVLTFATLGFGSIAPVDAVGKILVVIQVLLGYFMMGLLIAILTRKVLR